MMNNVLANVAEYDLEGIPHVVAHHEGTGRQTHYRLATGLYRALAGYRPEGADLLCSLLAGAQEVAPPPARHPLRYRIPFLPAEAPYGMVSGFGLAHRNKVAADKLNGSGRVAGHPAWFFKGFAHTLKTDGEPLRLSGAAQVVCEEAEMVLVYHVDQDRRPRYLGFTFGNDMTDIGQIRGNPAHLSYGKLGDSAIHPCLFLGEPPERADGRVRVVRDEETVWEGEITNGHAMLAYTVETMLSKLWLHHSLLVPGMVHYVYIGADRNSIDHGCRINSGDVVDISFDGFGVHLRNPVLLGEAA
jgi:hypothetical protein